MYKSPKLFLLIPNLETIELKGSKSTYCPRALTVYPAFEDEKSNVSKKWSTEESQTKRSTELI